MRCIVCGCDDFTAPIIASAIKASHPDYTTITTKEIESRIETDEKWTSDYPIPDEEILRYWDEHYVGSVLLTSWTDIHLFYLLYEVNITDIYVYQFCNITYIPPV